MLDFDDAVGRDLHVGAAEEVEADADVGGFVVGQVDDLCEALAAVEAEDADVVAHGEVGGGKFYVVVTLSEHGLQDLHLLVGDDGKLPTAFLATCPCRVHHEGGDA